MGKKLKKLVLMIFTKVCPSRYKDFLVEAVRRFLEDPPEKELRRLLLQGKKIGEKGVGWWVWRGFEPQTAPNVRLAAYNLFRDIWSMVVQSLLKVNPCELECQCMSWLNTLISPEWYFTLQADHMTRPYHHHMRAVDPIEDLRAVAFQGRFKGKTQEESSTPS